MAVLNTTSPVLVYPDGTAGATVTPSATPWGWSATVSLFASAAADLKIAGFIYTCSVGAVTEFDWALVVNGVDHVFPMVTLGQISGTPANQNGNNRFLLPVPIAVTSGQSVGVRLRKSGAVTATWTFAIEYFSGAVTGTVVSTTVPSKAMPSGAAAVSVTPGTNWADGSWAEITAATSADLVIGGIVVIPDDVTWAQFELDLSTGTAGNEAASIVTTIRGQTSHFFLADGYGGSGYVIPLWPLLDNVASGDRLSVRMRIYTASFGAGTWSVKLQYYEAPISIADLVTALPQVVVPAAANATGFGVVTPSFDWSDWVEYIASTATEIAVTSLVPNNGNISGSGGIFEVQVGIGAVGFETEVGSWMSYWSASGWYGDNHHVSLRLAPSIGSGQRVSLRARWVTSTVFDLGLTVALTYIASPDFNQRTITNQPSQLLISTAIPPGPNPSIPATPWDWTSWETYVAALDVDKVITALSIGPLSVTSTDWEVEIGTGATPTEITQLRGHQDTDAAGGRIFYLPVPLSVTAGTAIKMRTRWSASVARQVEWYIYGAVLPVSGQQSLTVYKVTSPSNDLTPFNFTVTGGLSPSTFVLSSGGSQAYADIAEGTYGVSEEANDLFDTTVEVSNGDPADAIVVGAEDNITVTFLNTRKRTFETVINPIRWLRRGPIYSQENTRVVWSKFVVDIQTGVGTREEPGMDPQVFMRVSYDGGHTWGNVRQVSVGRRGEYNVQAVFWRLGQGRNVVIEIYGADPVFTALVGAYADAQEGLD